MSDNPDDDFDARASPEDVDDAPTVSCTICDREWSLAYELDEMQVGNQSFEQFALDHMRHTGHFPDDVRPWVADCQNCREGEEFLSEGPARRWSKTHARHTRHSVVLQHEEETETVHDPEASANFE
ncbi:hypothetical protein [Halopelagius fulvigenes]|uniref:HNH endonuclease n=1 Tax=Halopelagius fulvigenes TaxID=1198324 RepID=A0ABD5TT92_9EURY